VGSHRGILGIGLGAALVLAGVDWAEKNVEVVTLHVAGRSSDFYPRLFVVDDAPAIWIRAERPDRLWLSAVRENPAVTVHRGDRDIAYHAQVGSSDAGHEWVDKLFRAKYGALDRLAAWVWRRDAVPIRLVPSDQYVGDF
jgi:hypothetical protein